MNDRIYELENKISEASYAYYNTGDPIMSDEEFDKLVSELRELDPDNKVIASVGFGMNNTNSDQELVVPMYGIPDKRRIDPSTNLMIPNGYVATHKLDGLAVQLVYDTNGNLVNAITRGDGIKGKCKLDHLKLIVPNIIDPAVGQVISGEVVMDRQTFEKYVGSDNVNRKHPRNVASGILNRDDTAEMNNLKFIAYRVLKSEKAADGIASYKSMLISLRLNGFNVVTPITMSDYYNLGSFISNGYSLSDTELSTVSCDGVVITPYFVNIDHDGIFHYDNVHAEKVDNEHAVTTVNGIRWTMGNTGRYIPTVLVDPVELGGCVIRKATANNSKWLSDMRCGIGSKIKIIRSGEIIPKVVEVVEPSDDLALPTHCQFCGRELINQGVDIVCNNPACDGLLSRKLHKFFNAFTYGIKGLGYALIEDIITENNICSIDDAFRVDARNRYTSGTKTDELKIKAFDQLRVPRTIDYFLVGMSVPKISYSGASKYMNTDIIKLLSGDNSVTLERPANTSRESYNYIMENLDDLRHLYSLVNIVDKEVTASESSDKLKVCVTGSLVHFTPRSKIFEELGDKIISADVKSCDVLVTNESKPTSKYKYAKANDIPVMTEDELLDKLKVLENYTEVHND